MSIISFSTRARNFSIVMKCFDVCLSTSKQKPFLLLHFSSGLDNAALCLNWKNAMVAPVYNLVDANDRQSGPKYSRHFLGQFLSLCYPQPQIFIACVLKKNLLSWFEVVCIYIYTCSITKTNFVKKGHKNVIITFGMTICTYLILLSLNQNVQCKSRNNTACKKVAKIVSLLVIYSLVLCKKPFDKLFPKRNRHFETFLYYENRWKSSKSKLGFTSDIQPFLRYTINFRRFFEGYISLHLLPCHF